MSKRNKYVELVMVFNKTCCKYKVKNIYLFYHLIKTSNKHSFTELHSMKVINNFSASNFKSKDYDRILLMSVHFAQSYNLAPLLNGSLMFIISFLVLISLRVDKMDLL